MRVQGEGAGPMLVSNGEAQKVIDKIMHLRLDRLSMQGVAQRLKGGGHPRPRGGHRHVTSVRACTRCWDSF